MKVQPIPTTLVFEDNDSIMIEANGVKVFVWFHNNELTFSNETEPNITNEIAMEATSTGWKEIK
jgi:hypothetical protein